MSTDKGRPLNQRALVSMLAIVSGIGLPITGLANHLHQMERMTSQRHAWMAAHWALGIIFTIAATWHVILNRRALLAHMKSVAGRIGLVSRECVCAVAIVAVVLWIAVGHTLLNHGGRH
jgi:hypothetical protein